MAPLVQYIKMRLKNFLFVFGSLLSSAAKSEELAHAEEQAQSVLDTAPPACHYDIKTAEFDGPNAQLCRAFCYVDKDISADRTATRFLAPFRAAQLLTDTLDNVLKNAKSTSEASRDFKNALVKKIEGYQK